MRKFAVACIALICGLLLAGCGSVVVGIRNLPDGRVQQTVRVNFEQAGADASEKMRLIQTYLDESFGLQDKGPRYETIQRADGSIHKFNFQMYVYETYSQSYFQLEFIFANQYSYAWFNGIDLMTTPPTHINTTRGLFFVEHTLTMQNPLQSFFQSQNNRVLNLVEHFNTLLDGDIDDVKFVYVMHSSFRRTRVYADHTRRTIGAWHYYFIADGPSDLQDIVIFERRANTTTWYLLGIFMTAAFMGGYFVLQRKRSA